MCFNQTSDRRRRRSDIPHVAMRLQLRTVAEHLGLDAIVLADDLGLPLAFAGDPQLSDLLAQASMWTWSQNSPVDWFTRDCVAAVDPSIDEDDFVSIKIPRQDQGGFWRVTAIGRRPDTSDGVEHAVTGIERIASELG